MPFGTFNTPAQSELKDANNVHIIRSYSSEQRHGPECTAMTRNRTCTELTAHDLARKSQTAMRWKTEQCKIDTRSDSMIFIKPNRLMMGQWCCGPLNGWQTLERQHLDIKSKPFLYHLSHQDRLPHLQDPQQPSPYSNFFRDP